MKALRVGIVLLAGVAVASCGGLFGGLFGGSGDGLPAFYDNVAYDAGSEEIYFRLVYQYDNYERNSAVDIEYDVLDQAGDVIESGETRTTEYDSYSLFWTTDEVRVSVPQSTYSGQTVTVFIDPDGKVTSSTWAMLEDDRKDEVNIP